MKKEDSNSNVFDLVSSIGPHRNCLRLRVRVIRMWTAFSYSESSKPFSVEMVLLDHQGGKIQASVRKTMISKILGCVKEGDVYIMTYFGVIPNLGSYRATQHEFKLVFLTRTKIVACDYEMIPRYGLSLVGCEDLAVVEGELTYLVDVIGVLTAVSNEKEYIRDGKTTKMIVVELTDDRGKIRCALFEDYVKVLNDYMTGCGDELPIVVIQFAKVKMFRGKVVMQNAMNASRIFFNGDIAEVIRFREGVTMHGIDLKQPLGSLGDSDGRVSIKDDFLKLNKKKTLSEMLDAEEDGIFIVFGKVKGLVAGEQWWYSACTCHKAVDVSKGLIFCDFCKRHVVKVTPRFKIKMEVTDGVEVAPFLLFDADAEHLLNKTCAEMIQSIRERRCVSYPPEINALVGKEMLFKVDFKLETASRFNDSFRVWRVCDDAEIIQSYLSLMGIEPNKDSDKVEVVGQSKCEESSLGDDSQAQVKACVSLVDDTSSIAQTRSYKKKIGFDSFAAGTASKKLRLKEIKKEED